MTDISLIVCATELLKSTRAVPTAMIQTTVVFWKEKQRVRRVSVLQSVKDSPYSGRKSNGCSVGQGHVPQSRKRISKDMRHSETRKVPLQTEKLNFHQFRQEWDVPR